MQDELNEFEDADLAGVFLHEFDPQMYKCFSLCKYILKNVHLYYYIKYCVSGSDEWLQCLRVSIPR